MTMRGAVRGRIVFSGIALLAVAGFADAQVIPVIANAAADSTNTGNIARGEIISIFGTNLSTSLGANFSPTSPVLSLAGASVTIGGLAAPLSYASPTQLDVQVPFEIPAGLALLVGAGFVALLDRVGPRWALAAPTERLIALARKVNGPIYMRCFPDIDMIADSAVRMRAPGATLIWDPARATEAKAEFCYQRR